MYTSQRIDAKNAPDLVNQGPQKQTFAPDAPPCLYYDHPITRRGTCQHRRGAGLRHISEVGAGMRATALLQAAQPGGRHSALYDAAVLLAEAGADRATAEAFLTAGALAMGLSENSATRKAICQGFDKGAASRGVR